MIGAVLACCLVLYFAYLIIDVVAPAVAVVSLALLIWLCRRVGRKNRKAIKDFDKAELAPKNVEAYFPMARAKYALGQRASADIVLAIAEKLSALPLRLRDVVARIFLGATNRSPPSSGCCDGFGGMISRE